MVDYLIVGSGLAGATCARILTDSGYSCLVIDKRDHIGGNCYDENIDGIMVHKYGPHIFHTSNDEVWKFVNTFSEFNDFVLRIKAINGYEEYTLPINLTTMKEVYGSSYKQLMKIMKLGTINEDNFESYLISKIGLPAYKLLFKDYTEKQWGRSAASISVDIAKRMRIRDNHDDNYFDDKYQGIPVNGYTEMIKLMLQGIPVKTNIDFKAAKNKFQYKNLIYTGSIDEYYDYVYGKLEYRSLEFEHEKLPIRYFQDRAQVNYTDKRPYTRIIEHKHFNNSENVPFTIITKEYPWDYNGSNDRYYPIGSTKNMDLYKTYSLLNSDNVYFTGRLGSYKYLNMDQVILQSMKLCETLIKK